MNDHELEAALRRVMRPVPPQDDARRVVDRLQSLRLPPQRRSLAWWPAALTDPGFAPAWPRLATLAGAAALGISIGLSGPGARIAADLDLVRVAAAEDAGANVFDVDFATGLRP